MEAAEARMIAPILVGPTQKIRSVAAEFGLEPHGIEIVDAPHSHAAAARAVALVREGRGELLMKGSLHTDELLAAGHAPRDPACGRSGASATSSSWTCRRMTMRCSSPMPP